MGWAKYDEDIREKIDNRMKDSSCYYYGNAYINHYPDYPSRKSVSTTTTYYVPQSTYCVAKSTCRQTTTVTIPIVPVRSVVSKLSSLKKKIGYLQRNHEHCGIEIYFYNRPNENVLNELKIHGWHWHVQKTFWYRKYSTSNQQFAEKIIEQ